ncbi:linear amide C-N hydrolase [Neopusillimonas aromaticivorans]|jgi:choloylglycine hydrolase|uniref:linear amide C-N hydrolase n=1 Tax=Neopusillimonas aromaticivorans TaxID=2979868 RepID=UPI0025958273|nr:linear amide C-N hydrolase [Neopusillimonas aromaticivorans]WJJ93328.1 linear amide C-N hydrolase [Neopusillimonas aromaticivorans]
MKKGKQHWKRVGAAALAGLLALPAISQACTSLLYTDERGTPYAGRTMELPMELPYEVTYFPVGSKFDSQVKAHPELDYASKYAFVSVTVPDPVTKGLKVVEGINEAGMSFSLLAFASTEGPRDMVEKTRAVLSAIDLGAWTLSNFKNVAEVKAALAKQPVLVTALLPLGVLKTPFHYTLHDAAGASIVIEFSQGKQHVIDNPIGVMTNGPEFQWHQTNLNNYTFLNNKDQSKLTLNGVTLQQPDSGIATVALPASNTSVGRFVRAVYYSQFAEKAKTPDEAVLTLSHVMNNFDRPRGITIDERFEESIENIAAPAVTGEPLYTSEYTSWTALSDLDRRTFYVRSYGSINYVDFDLNRLKQLKTQKSLPLKQFERQAGSGTAAFFTPRS